jgi:SlyX protein
VSETGDILGRLQELESQLAFQDELHQQLNEVVARQDREIRDLREQLKSLSRRLKEIGDSVAGETAGAGEEMPPHY